MLVEEVVAEGFAFAVVEEVVVVEEEEEEEGVALLALFDVAFEVLDLFGVVLGEVEELVVVAAFALKEELPVGGKMGEEVGLSILFEAGVVMGEGGLSEGPGKDL